jgi:D-alanine-D-alanine ligase
MKRIVILYGGKSGEHEVSLISAASIVKHIDLSRFEPILVGITKDGSWHLQESGLVASFRALSKGPEASSLPLLPGARVLVSPGSGLVAQREGRLEELPCDIVFPVLHGSFGEDGTIQGLLEVAGLPYVGASVLGSALAMDKEKSKELWVKAGLPVVPFVLVRRNDDCILDGPGSQAMEHLARKIGGRFGWPAFVKPACSGSSVGASIVRDAGTLHSALLGALEWDEKAMIEPFVNGREIECSVLGNEEPVAFAPGEVESTHEFYDYDAKYIDPNGARLEIPARIDERHSSWVKELAVAAYRACELSGMARIDLFIDRTTGEVLLNEANTIPGFTHISMYPKMCEADGLPYPELITRLAELALERHAARERIRYSR